jgi:hypothetical protein
MQLTSYKQVRPTTVERRFKESVKKKDERHFNFVLKYLRFLLRTTTKWIKENQGNSVKISKENH